MVALSLILDGTQEASGPPFDPATVLHVTGMVKVIGMPNGTQAGKPTVMIRATLPDGRDVFIETTLALFVTAARGLLARYGEPA
jgi:hypothetical protein